MSEAIITIDENGKPVTPNYGLIKPTGEDFYDIEDHNTNMDTIDTALKSQSESIQSQQAVIKILEEEVEGLEFTWDSIQNKPTLFPPSSHTHDDRYYTETEANSRFAPSSHTHPYASTAVATQNANGLQSAADKKKLDGIATGANKYVHPGSGTNPHKTTKADVGLGSVVNSGMSSSVSSTSTTTYANSAAARTAYNKGVEALNKANEAFQSADSGKKALATAITAKGVSASATDTFATLSNKVGQIASIKMIKEMNDEDGSTDVYGIPITRGPTLTDNTTTTITPLGFMSILSMSGTDGAYIHVTALDTPLFVLHNLVDANFGGDASPVSKGETLKVYIRSGRKVIIMSPSGGRFSCRLENLDNTYDATVYYSCLY